MKNYLGVIGDPIKHTLSPIMHNAALNLQKQDYCYLPFRVTKENLKKVLEGFKVLNFVGLNVTIPHKVSIISYLDRISYEADLIGAVNTIHFRNGELIGYNTDAIGFHSSLKEDGGVDPKGKRILLFGAGGAARAVAVQLGLSGAKEIVIANRTRFKGEELANELIVKLPGRSYRAIGFEYDDVKSEMVKTEIIVNATPIGMESYDKMVLPIEREWFHSEHLVVDLVYKPLMTPLLKIAQKAGTRTLSGLSMLLYQGAESYRIWTGMEPPIEVMRQALYDQVG